MEAFANMITDRLIRNGITDEGNRDIYIYGLVHLLSNIVGVFITVAIGIIFGISLEMLLFFISFTALRMSAGGYHAGSFGKCFAISLCAIVSAAMIIRNLSSTIYLPVVLSTAPLSLLVVFILSPITDEDRPMTSYEVHKFRKRSRTLVVGYATMDIIAAALGGRYTYFVFCAALGNLAATASILAAYIKKLGGLSHEEE
jgi:accessory gene regulator B